MSAEASVADADAGFCAEDCGDERIGHPFDVEGDDADLVVEALRRTVQANAVDSFHARVRVVEQVQFMGGNGLHPDALQDFDGFGKGDCADDVRTSCLILVRRPSPVCLVLRYCSDNAAANRIRCPPFKKILRSDEHAGAERRIHFVRRIRDEVKMLRVVVRKDVDGAMRCQLGGVDKNSRSCSVCPACNLVHGRTDSCDVRRAVERNELELPFVFLNRRLHRRKVEMPIVMHADVDDGCVLSPWQVVRVMFHQRRDDDVARLKVEPIGKLVHALRRVLGEDDAVRVEVCTDELAADVVRTVEGFRCNDGFVSRPSMHPGIPGQKVLDAFQHAPKRRRARRVIQKYITALRTVEHRHHRLDADDVVAQLFQPHSLYVVVHSLP